MKKIDDEISKVDTILAFIPMFMMIVLIFIIEGLK